MARRTITEAGLAQRIAQYRAEGTRGSIGCGNSLFAEVGKSGTVTFFFRQSMGGSKYRSIRLGIYGHGRGTMTLNAARARAAELREGTAALEGTPQEFAVRFDEWLEHKGRAGLSEDRMYRLRRAGDQLKKVLGGSMLTGIYPMRVLDGLEADGLQPHAVRKAAAMLREFLDWAVACGYLDSHRCASISKLITVPKTQHHASLRLEEIRTVFEAWQGQPETAKAYMLMVALTGLRRDNAGLMRWSWINEAEKTIAIPAAEFKTGREFRIPVTVQLGNLLGHLRAWAIARRQPDTGEGQVFAGLQFRELSGRMSKLTKGKMSMHGWRSTLDTWLSQQMQADGTALKYPTEVREAFLGHANSNVIAGIYNRDDFMQIRRAGAQEWADALTSQMTPDFLALVSEGRIMPADMSYPAFEPEMRYTINCTALCTPTVEPRLAYLEAGRVQFDIGFTNDTDTKIGRGVISTSHGHFIMRLKSSPMGTYALDRAATREEAQAFVKDRGLMIEAVSDLMDLCHCLLNDPLIRLSLDRSWREAG